MTTAETERNQLTNNIATQHSSFLWYTYYTNIADNLVLLFVHNNTNLELFDS